MQDIRVSVLTREYLDEPVQITNPLLDLTTTPVWVALVPAGANPASGDWKSAAWFYDPATATTVVRAKLGDDLPLTQGIFVAWLRINLGDQEPVREFARLYVD